MNYKTSQKNAKREKRRGESEVHNETEKEIDRSNSCYWNDLFWRFVHVDSHIFLCTKDVGYVVCDMVFGIDFCHSHDANTGSNGDEIERNNRKYIG